MHARDLKGEDYSVISVIGDGSLTGGMAYEALNNASSLKTNFIIVLNDNNMSISENVGGMSKYLANLRTADLYTGLKKGVTNVLQQVPVVGESMIEHIRKTKNSCYSVYWRCAWIWNSSAYMRHRSQISLSQRQVMRHERVFPSISL